MRISSFVVICYTYLTLTPLHAQQFFTQVPPSSVRASAIDRSGNIYLTGYTDSEAIPVTPNAFQRTFAACSPTPQVKGTCAHAFVLKLIVDLLPRFAAILRALHLLAEPAAALRDVDSVRIDRRSLEVVDLPAGEMRPADVPASAGAVRRQDEGPLPGAHQHTHCAHETRPPRAALGGAYLMPTTIESGPTSASVRADVKPASFIQPSQSAPV